MLHVYISMSCAVESGERTAFKSMCIAKLTTLKLKFPYILKANRPKAITTIKTPNPF